MTTRQQIDEGKLLDCAGVMRYLGVSRKAAEKIMRRIPKVEFDDLDKVYVKRADVDRHIDQRTRAA